MSDGTDNLTGMANQIAANLAHERDPAAAVAEHIRHFWDPRMRQRFRDQGASGLSPIASAALDLMLQHD